MNIAQTLKNAQKNNRKEPFERSAIGTRLRSGEQ